jgi:hypothetical protein
MYPADEPIGAPPQGEGGFVGLTSQQPQIAICGKRLSSSGIARAWIMVSVPLVLALVVLLALANSGRRAPVGGDDTNNLHKSPCACMAQWTSVADGGSCASQQPGCTVD